MLTARVAHFREVHVKPREPHVAKGTRPKKRGAYPVVSTVGFDEETWVRMQAAAVRNKCSMSELVRTYCQWGLDEEDHAS